MDKKIMKKIQNLPIGFDAHKDPVNPGEGKPLSDLKKFIKKFKPTRFSFAPSIQKGCAMVSKERGELMHQALQEFIDRYKPEAKYKQNLFSDDYNAEVLHFGFIYKESLLNDLIDLVNTQCIEDVRFLNEEHPFLFGICVNEKRIYTV